MGHKVIYPCALTAYSTLAQAFLLLSNVLPIGNFGLSLLQNLALVMLTLGRDRFIAVPLLILWHLIFAGLRRN